MKQYLTATIQALNQDELKTLIDPQMLSRIKQLDPDPEIRVYSIGHEGEANMHLPGIGNKTFTWIQAAVQWISDKLNLGTAVFDRHDPNTNSHTGRTQIGEVIGKATRKLGNSLNTLAAVHIYPNFKSRPLDVASIEAEIEYDHDQYQAWPIAVNNVSGIALSNSGIDHPGFPGATLLGAVQAYVQAFAGDIGEKPMNVSEVKAAVKELGLKPGQVFAAQDLLEDPAVTEASKKGYQDTLNANERLKRERDEARNTISKLENEKAESDRKLANAQVQSKSSTVIESILNDPERKLDDKAKAFVKRSLKRFTTEAADEDGLKTDLTKFVEDSVAEYGELAKDVFGVDLKQSDDRDSQYRLPRELLVGGEKPNGDEGQQSSAVPQNVDYRDNLIKTEMNPDLNPLIPGGKAATDALKT